MPIINYPDPRKFMGYLILDYFYIPKFIVEDSYFKNLSAEAKLLYSRFVQLALEAREKKQQDSSGRFYITITIKEIQEFLNCSCHKAQDVLKELDFRNGIGLIIKTGAGRGCKTIIYVNWYKKEE